MRISMAIGLAAAGLAAAGCSEALSQEAGPSVDRTYQVGQFSKLRVAGPYEVEVRTGGGTSVSASGPVKSLERMVVEVDGDTLKIHPRKRSGPLTGYSGDRKVRLSVQVPSLAAAEIAGSGNISIDRISGESFDGGVAGSGDLRLGQLQVNRLKMGIAGSGGIRADGGTARQAAFEVAGSGDIEASGLTTETAAVSIAGSGNVDATASQTASVDIVGSGDVRLRGGARCTVRKAGSGSVDCS